MLDLSGLDLEKMGNALADQTDYEHRWLISPQTGEIVFWTADTASTARHQSTSMNWTCLHRPAAILDLVPGHGRLRRSHPR
jgi:hypothetical protein